MMIHADTAVAATATAAAPGAECAPAKGGGGVFKTAALQVLRRERKLMSTGDVTRTAIRFGIIGQLPGKTPEATMASALYTDIKKWKDGKAGSVFCRPREGLFGLREWADDKELCELVAGHEDALPGGGEVKRPRSPMPSSRAPSVAQRKRRQRSPVTSSSSGEEHGEDVHSDVDGDGVKRRRAGDEYSDSDAADSPAAARIASHAAAATAATTGLVKKPAAAAAGAAITGAKQQRWPAAKQQRRKLQQGEVAAASRGGAGDSHREFMPDWDDAGILLLLNAAEELDREGHDNGNDNNAVLTLEQQEEVVEELGVERHGSGDASGAVAEKGFDAAAAAEKKELGEEVVRRDAYIATTTAEGTTRPSSEAAGVKEWRAAAAAAAIGGEMPPSSSAPAAAMPALSQLDVFIQQMATRASELYMVLGPHELVLQSLMALAVACHRGGYEADTELALGQLWEVIRAARFPGGMGETVEAMTELRMKFEEEVKLAMAADHSDINAVLMNQGVVC